MCDLGYIEKEWMVYAPQVLIEYFVLQWLIILDEMMVKK